MLEGGDEVCRGRGRGRGRRRGRCDLLLARGQRLAVRADEGLGGLRGRKSGGRWRRLVAWNDFCAKRRVRIV